MKKNISGRAAVLCGHAIISAALIFTLTGCAEYGAEKGSAAESSEQSDSCDEQSEFTPLNYENQKAIWLPYLDFNEYMYGKTADEYKSEVEKILSEASAQGINTVYFHVHPEGDAYYKSEIYPRGRFLDGDYDPLRIFLDAAHSMNISVHGWLNPYRMQTAEQMEQLPNSFIVKQWISNGSPMVRLVGERWYLNPAYSAVNDLICNSALEIIENYPVDGIHIDDYFYPDTSPEFDTEAFEASGAASLDDWRREKVTSMVKALYDTVKGYGSQLKFGVSPQGNISADYNTQYADVELWTQNKGYADYIVPQIYYGFENEVCPFEETLRRWEKLAENENVELVIGLAQYKEGKYDKWAGIAGENEWIENDDIIARQKSLVEASTIADGYALYR